MKTTNLSPSLFIAIAALFFGGSVLGQAKLIFSANTAQSVSNSAVALDSTTKTMACGTYMLYANGKKPKDIASSLMWQKIDERQLPLSLQLLRDTEKKWFYISIPKELCGETVELADKIKFWIVSGTAKQGASPLQPSLRNGQNARHSLNSLAKYRLTYDVRTGTLSLWKWRRRGWKQPRPFVPYKNRILRPGVNRFIDLEYVNFNDTRDDILIKYAFENLNLDSHSDFLASFQVVRPTVSSNEDSGGAEAVENGGNVNKPNPQDMRLNEQEVKEELRQLNAGNNLKTNEIKLYSDFLNSEEEKIERGEEVNFIQLDKKLRDMPKEVQTAMRCEGFELGTCIAGLQPNSSISLLLDSSDTVNLAVENQAAIDKAFAQKQLDQLRSLITLFESELSTARQAAVTPDKAIIKRRLTTALEKRKELDYILDLSAKDTFEDQLDEFIESLKKFQLIEEDDTELMDEIKRLQANYQTLTVYKQSALAALQVQDYDVLKLQVLNNDTVLNSSPYRFYTRGGWKIDFSSGIVVSNLVDEKYYYSSLRTATSTTSNIVLGTEGDSTVVVTNQSEEFATIEKGKVDEVNWGVAVMAHFYPRSAYTFGTSFTMGTLVTQDNVSLLLGGSILLGRQQRLVLSGGVIYGNVRRLSDGYQVGEEYSVTNAALNSSVPHVESRMQRGGFFGVSYNLTGVTAKKQ